MTKKAPLFTLALVLGFTLVGGARQPPPSPATPPPPQQPTEIGATNSSGAIGAPPKYAVPDFIALSTDPQTEAAAKTIGQVLWDDLNFEREFYMIPRDTYQTVPAAHSFEDVPFDQWRELGTDALVIGTVERTDGGNLRVQVRLFNVKSHQSVFAKEYTGPGANARFYAHTISDEIFKQQSGLAGVARTKIAFASDRDEERMPGTVLDRTVKEIYISDYDGANQRRVTVNRSLNIVPAWSPDAQSIAYTSYRRGVPEIFISFIYKGTLEEATKGPSQNFLPAWSPDGKHIAFMSDRDGHDNIYVMDADGSHVRQVTHGPGPSINASPTWSPSGTEIAFTSDRSGSPQIYVVGADGLGLRRITHETYCDRPTWSPPPYNEIAYASQTGPGFDIKILDLETGQVRQVTFGEGSNQSPSFAPNGRHLAFTSTRTGHTEIFTIGRDGKGLRQITTKGSNYQPSWSH